MAQPTAIRPEQTSWRDLDINTKGRTSGQIKTLCPKCSGQRQPRNQKDACLSVNLDDEIWKCHNCDWSGTLKTGEERSSRPFHREQTPKTYVTPIVRQPDPNTKLSVDAVKMLKARGIEPKTATDAGVFVTNHYFGRFEKEVPSLCFPFVKDSTVVNAKYRPIDTTGFDPEMKTFAQETGAEPIWYGLDWCKDAGNIVIVEGEFDALTFRQIGYPAVLSVPNGSPKTHAEVTSKFDFFASGEEVLKQATNVIIAIEQDGPGNIMAEEIARRVGKDKCYRLFYPQDCKDANDVLRTHGAAELDMLVKQAPVFPTAGIVSPLELRNRVMHFRQHGLPPGFECGFPSLDTLYKAVPGQTTITVGVPTHGKTTVADSVMLGWAIRNKWVIGIFTPENYPQELYMVNLLQKVKRKRFEEFTTEEIERGLEWLDAHVKLIQPDLPTLPEIRDRIEFLVKREGARALIVDPWTEIQTEAGFGTQNDFIKSKLTDIRQHARDWDYHLYVDVHPRKMHEAKDVDGVSRTDKPSAYDIMDSSHFANKGDIIMSVWRDPTIDLSPIEVSVVKARHRRYGRRGTMLMNYHENGEFLTDGGFSDDPYASQRANAVEDGSILDVGYKVGDGDIQRDYPDA